VLGGLESAGCYLVAQGSGCGTEPPGEGLPEPFVLSERLSLPPGDGVEAHQAGVRLLVGRFF
jgi:hypothetical protein